MPECMRSRQWSLAIRPLAALLNDSDCGNLGVASAEGSLIEGSMIGRFGAGKALLLWIFACAVAITMFVRYSARLEQTFGRPWVSSLFGMALFSAFLIFYRLMQECFSSRESGPSVSEWQPLVAIDAQYRPTAPSRSGRENEVVEFRMSPWPWAKAVGLVMALISLPVVLIAILNVERFQRLPFNERFALPLLLLAFVSLAFALFGGLFILNYRLIHFRVGAYGCNFRLGPIHGADHRNIISSRHGAFPLDCIGALWSRERLSSILKWKLIHYGITFKAGDQLRLGTKGRYSTDLAALDWEKLLIELSRRSGVAIDRDKLAQVSIGSP